MLSINGTAMHCTQRELRRACGCPSIMGSWPRRVANYRDFGTELDR